MKHEQVGTHFTYAFEKGWHSVCSLPESVAWEWLLQVAPNALIAGYQGITVSTIKNGEHSTYGWMSKLAVVVENRQFTDIAIYLHDREFLLMEKRLM